MKDDVISRQEAIDALSHMMDTDGFRNGWAVSESAEEVYNLIKEQKYPKYANGAFEERAQK